MLLALALALGCGASGVSADPLAEAERELQRAAHALHAAQRRVAALRDEAAAAPRQPRAGAEPLPPGNYTKSCSGCGRMGQAVWCTCGGAQTALSLSSCAEGDNATLAEIGGFLTCDWKAQPPPRVGNVTSSGSAASAMCRVAPHTTFMAPQFKVATDPLASAVLLHDKGTADLLGTWTGVASDGTTLDDTYLIDGPPSAIVVSCIDAGPMASARICNPDAVVPGSHPDGNGGAGWLWTGGTGSISGTSLSVKFDTPTPTQGSGTASVSGGGTMITWDDGSVWIRRAPDEAAACCARCMNSTACKAWTVATIGTLRMCQLASSTKTAYPSLNAYSGYPIEDDAASWCEHVDDNGANVVMMDRHVPPSIGCGSMAPSQAAPSANASDPAGFPRAWGGGGPAWFFFPCEGGNCSAAEHCDCSRTDNTPGSMVCTGPTFDAALVQKHVTGKKWIVFIHGGEFAWNNNIGAGYAILSANVALASDMGVVAIDYRRSQGGSNPYPAAINDVLQAVAWLDSKGAASVSLYGDSSGATQVVQTLLLISHRRNTGVDYAPNISSAVTFSAWLDLTGANPGWRTHQYCTGTCLDIASPDSGMNTAGWGERTPLAQGFCRSAGMLTPAALWRADSLKGMCAATQYAGGLPISHPLLSPVHAGPELLRHLPPLLLIVGGTEILMPETLVLAQHAQVRASSPFVFATSALTTAWAAGGGRAGGGAGVRGDVVTPALADRAATVGLGYSCRR